MLHNSRSHDHCNQSHIKLEVLESKTINTYHVIFDLTKMSLVAYDDDDLESSRSLAIATDHKPKQKVLEEEEYLDRMSKIIKRDFFANHETPGTSHGQSCLNTPATGRTDCSSTSSTRSRKESCSMRLDDFLDKYTSEDNAYFEKQQKKELRRHRSRYPYLYRDGNQLQIASTQGSRALESSKTSTRPSIKESTVNYSSNRYIQAPLFKEPLPIKAPSDRPRLMGRTSEKVGIDGKMLDGSDTITFSEPLLPQTAKACDIPVAEVKLETKDRFYIPNESPRADLARRLYDEKVASKIRTPRSSTRYDSKHGTPSTLRLSKWRRYNPNP